MLETADVQQQWDLLAPGVQHSEIDAATAGTVQSENHAAINPFAHGQTNAYDLGIALGIAHQMVPQSDITFQTVSISH